MTIEQLRGAYERLPFDPFVMHLADGREVPVLARDFISPAPNGRTIVVWQPDASMNIIDLLLVTDLEFKAKNGKRKKRPGLSRIAALLQNSCKNTEPWLLAGVLKGVAWGQKPKAWKNLSRAG